MTWVQEISECDSHEECIAIAIIPFEESGREDGVALFVSHAPTSLDVMDRCNPDVPDVVDERSV